MSIASKLIMASGSVGGSENYTTPGTYYWTAPVGVTTVDVTGQGGSRGTSTTWTSLAPYKYMVGGIFIDHPSGGTYNSMGLSLGSSLTYEYARAIGGGYLSQWNNVTTSSSGAYYSNLVYTYFNYDTASGTWYKWPNFPLSGTYRRTGSLTAIGTLTTATGTIPTTGYVSKSMYPNNIEAASTSTVYGTDSTAFGQTFPDDSSQSTVTGVSVTAGTQYTIVVGTDKGADTAFVSFDYY